MSCCESSCGKELMMCSGDSLHGNSFGINSSSCEALFSMIIASWNRNRTDSQQSSRMFLRSDGGTMVIQSKNLGLSWGLSLEEDLNARITLHVIFAEIRSVLVRRL